MLTVTRAAGVAIRLGEDHYLGAVAKGTAYHDERGIIVLSHPTTRYVPCDWLEVTRWCLYGERNAGSQQWAELRRLLVAQGVTTVISYSDPTQGHTGALYRAAGWLWAPTPMWWQQRDRQRRRRPSDRAGTSVKERWIDPLAPDPRRLDILRPDHHVARWALREHGDDALWREPKIRRGRIVRCTGGARYRTVR